MITLKDKNGEAHFLPWAQLMQLGLGNLRLSSTEFWAMTPLELITAIEGVLGPQNVRAVPLERRALEALQKRFPD